MRKSLDVSQSALLGVLIARKHQIRQPYRMTCDGCGVDVYCSKSCVAPARQAARARGHRLYIVCPSCSEPFLQEAAEGGELEASSQEALNDVLREILRRRRAFLAGQN